MATLAKTPRSTMITLASTSSGPFILTFRLFDADTIRVYRNGEVETGYTLDATFEDGYTDSASITLDVAGEPGDVIIIDSDLNPHRAQDYLRGDPNIVDKLNIELARIWAAIRDTRQKADRSLRSFQDEEPVSGEAGQVLMIGESGFDAGPTADEVSAAQGYAESAAESAATAALLAGVLETAAYGESIPFYVAAAPQTIALPTGTIVDSVFISGLAQQRGASWTQSGNILRLNEPGAIGMYGWYRYRIMEGEFAGQSNTFNGRSAAVAAANGVAWPVGSIIADGTVQYRYAGSGTLIPDMPGWVPHGDFVQPEHFAANTVPGTTDMLAAINAAISYSAQNSMEGRFLNAVYAVSGTIVWQNGAYFVGAGNWSGVRSDFRETSITVLRYIGAGGANSCVVRLANAAVGVESDAFTGNMTSIGLTNVTADGNGRAEIGFYFNRSWSNNEFDYLCATNTVKHGFWAGNCWNGSPTNWVAFRNIGAGITLGINTFGWSQCTVDQSTCTSFLGFWSGRGLADANFRNAFNTTTNADKEYGIGIGNGRGLVMVNAQAMNCSGAGWYVAPDRMNPVLFVGGYLEGCGRSTGNGGYYWAVWYKCTINTRNVVFRSVHFGTGTYGADIKITGSPDTTRKEAVARFYDCPIVGKVVADHAYYDLVNCDRSAVIVGSAPVVFAGRFGGTKNLVPIARVNFWINGTTPTIISSEGVPVTIAYVSSGVYTLTLSEAQADSNWLCTCHTSQVNRAAVATGYSASACTINYTVMTTAAVSDPTASNLSVRLVIYGSRA